MSNVYTTRQMRFVHAFAHHIHPMLSTFLHMESNSHNASGSVETILDNTSTAINTVSAAVAIAGVATAVPTLGASVVGAGACIVLLQTLDGCSKFVKRRMDNKDEPFSPNETKLDEIQLSLTIMLRQVAYLAAVRYRHFIDEILEEHSVNTFAHFVGDRAMKKLAAELVEKDELTTTLNAEMFLDYLMASARLSFTQQATTVIVKEEYDIPRQCLPSAMYAKLACSLPGLAVYDNPSAGEYILYVSPQKGMFSRDKTTLHKHYGFATVPQSELNSETATINRKTLEPLSPVSMQETLSKNKQHFSLYHQVSKQEVIDYLTAIRAPRNVSDPVRSLNQYLSESLGKNVIAACNDNRLSGLDLSDGHFSETWFVNADLSHCNLRNTVWVSAHLNGAKFESNDLTDSNFQHAFAEKSSWRHVKLSGNFSHTRLNGSKLADCTISHNLIQFGCHWELVEMESVKSDDAMQLLKLRFDEQVTRGLHLAHEINALNQQYEVCMNQATENHNLAVKEEHQLTMLHKKVQELNTKYAQHLTQLDFRQGDIKTQFLRFQNEQAVRWEKQNDSIQRITRRLDRLEHPDQVEHKSDEAPSSVSRRPSFFKFNHGVKKTKNKETSTSEAKTVGPRPNLHTAAADA